MSDRGGHSDRDSKRARHDDRDRGWDRYDARDRGRDRREHEHERPRERGDRRDRYDERDRRDRPHDDRTRERERVRERERERPPPEQRERPPPEQRERPPREYGDRGRGRGDRELEPRPAQIRPGGRGSGAEARAPPAPPAATEKQPASIMSAQELAELEERKKREEADYKKRVEEQVELMEMDDEEREQRLIEERRRRRAEIAAKFKAQPPSASAATDAAALTAVPAPEKHKVESSASAAASTGNGSAPGPPNGGGAAAGPHAEPSALAAPPAGDERAPQTEQGEQVDGAESESEEGEFPAASRVMSSDLSLEDRKKETELRAFMLAHRRQTEGGQQQSRRERAAPAAAAAALSSADTAQKTGADEEVDGGFDMFNDDVEEVTNPELMLDEAAAMDRGDNYDDKEGYYAHRVGDVLGERYKVLGSFGKGVFSTVVKCEDLRAGPGDASVVAIKVQRNNEMMRRAGEKEVATLIRLRDADPENRKHCIRLLGRFDHEDHLCMVFEAFHQNLRMAVKQFGHRRGIQIDAVRTYARQLFVALRHMEKLGIVHADLKPDNVVVNDRYNLLKVCDFGSAIEADDQEITPYMVSRFYRAPEIMMGLHFSCPIDMWAAATSLYELYTGKIMFAGHSNNQMLKGIMEVKGKMPHKLIRKGVFSELHFDPDYDFLYKEKDRVTGRDVIRLIKFEQRPMPGRDLKSLLTGGAKLTEAENRKVMMLADLLDKATTLDPAKRITPSQALRHPFCDLTRK